MIGAGEVERCPSKFGGQAFALQGRGNFGVAENDAVRETAVSEECAQAVDLRFKTLRFFVVCDGDGFEVQIHESPSGLIHFFIPEIAQSSGRTLIDLLDDAIAGGAGDVDPRADMNVENLTEAPDAFSGVDANARFPDHCNFAVGVSLVGIAHEFLRVTAEFYQGIRE
jgi:hypothetical protein